MATHNPNRPHPDTHESHAQEPPRLAIVVGAHPAAEISDRPIAAALAATLANLWTQACGTPPAPGQILVITDMWYVNDPSLRTLPTIAIGPPEHNAFTAYLADKLPSVHVIDGQLIVQAEVSFAAPVAACWGISGPLTWRAAEVFISKLADTFVAQAAGMPA